MKQKIILTAIASLLSISVAVFYYQPSNATNQSKKLNVVLIGDSYSAGNGAGDYTGVKNCYRSQRNWAQLYIRWLNNQGIATTFQNRACSGSKIEDLYNYHDLEVYSKTALLPGNLTGQSDTLYQKIQQTKVCDAYTVDDSIETRLSVTDATYMASTKQTRVEYKCFQRLRPQLEFVGPETDLVLMTIGGNDLEFAKIVEQCFFFQQKTRCQKLINSATSKLPDIKNDLVNLIKIMRERGLRPDAKVILLGYPLLSLNNNHSIGFWPPHYPVAQEIRALGLAGNQAQAEAVAIDNRSHPGQVTFINSVPRHFSGHEPHPALHIENHDRWLHEFSGYALLDTHAFYHPNLMGHANYTHLLKQLPTKLPTKTITNQSSDLDIVFNIDTSGSMDKLLSHVQENVRSIIEQVRAKSNSARFAITTFRDFPQRTKRSLDYPAKVDLAFSSDITKIQQAINQLEVSGGGDHPETALSGILAGLNLQWRAGVHKTVITITDAPPHDPEPISGLTSTQIIKRAFEVDPAELYFIELNKTDSESYSSMAKSTGGKVFQTNTSLVSDILLKSIDTAASKPHAWINGPYITKLGRPLEIDGAGSYSKVGKITKYEWDFDSDGRIDFVSNQPIITYTFNKELYGLMTLKVTDDHGLVNIANTHLIVSIDGDDVPTDVDNCPLVDNHGQTDSDKDGIGDLCDETPGVELPEHHRDYFECLIKQHFHPETECHYSEQLDTPPTSNSSSTFQPSPKTPVQSSSKSQQPPQNLSQQQVIALDSSKSNNAASSTISPTKPDQNETRKQLDHTSSKTTDPKWLWISLPIILASLFGGYLIIQKVRR